MVLIKLITFICCCSFFNSYLFKRSLNKRSSFFPPNYSTRKDTKYVINILQQDGIQQIKANEWNNLLYDISSQPIEKYCPFLRYEWLNALEKSGCASGETGWQPLHIVVYESLDKEENNENLQLSNQKVLAIMPLYVKYHSQGEFIFDHSWANYAENVLRIPFYPKLLSAIPMTPATCSKLLFHHSIEENERKNITVLFSNILKNFATNYKFSSANLNFMIKEEADYFCDSGDFSLRETIQYRWQNYNNITKEKFTDFDDYLNCFKSKKRTQIKRERQKVYVDQQIRVEVINGADESKASLEFYLIMFELYKTTVEKMWGSQYLNEEFFINLFNAKDFKHHLLFIVAYDNNNEIVAGTINLVSKSHFYGRYWGAFKFVPNLHFEVCYYKAIEYCIDNNISFMEPGAGGGEFKFLRGFDPFIINSAHYITNYILRNAVDDFLDKERQMNRNTADYLIANSALRKDNK